MDLESFRQISVAKRSSRSSLPGIVDSPQLAGRVNSPTAASEQSSLLNQGLADRPLSGNRYGRFGSNSASHQRLAAHKGESPAQGEGCEAFKAAGWGEGEGLAA